MNNNHKMYVAFAALGVLGSSLVAADADASDRKTHHAAFCQATNGVDANYNRSPYRITRVSGSAGHLICPIAHDVFECSGWGGCVKGFTVEVSVFDWHSQEDISCTLSAHDKTGNAYWWKSDKTASTATCSNARCLRTTARATRRSTTTRSTRTTSGAPHASHTRRRMALCTSMTTSTDSDNSRSSSQCTRVTGCMRSTSRSQGVYMAAT